MRRQSELTTKISLPSELDMEPSKSLARLRKTVRKVSKEESENKGNKEENKEY